MKIDGRGIKTKKGHLLGIGRVIGRKAQHVVFTRDKEGRENALLLTEGSVKKLHALLTSYLISLEKKKNERNIKTN